MGPGFQHGCNRVPEVEHFQYCKPIFYASAFTLVLAVMLCWQACIPSLYFWKLHTGNDWRLTVWSNFNV